MRTLDRRFTANTNASGSTSKRKSIAFDVALEDIRKTAIPQPRQASSSSRQHSSASSESLYRVSQLGLWGN